MLLRFFIIFILLLLLSNSFLLKDGLWFYQDQSFWSKNFLESFLYLNTQLHAFNNLSYYLGFDQGILSANNIFTYIFNLVLLQIFGTSISQIVASLVGYILAFISFFAFSTLFFKDRKIQYILALLFTFSPLLYSFRGYGYIYAVAPLFIYSFFKYYTTDKHRGLYLLLNILACSLWIANVRFLQLNFFIVLPYLAYLLFVIEKPRLHTKRLLGYLATILLIFLPVIFMLLTPLFSQSPSIFNYGIVFNNFVATGSFYDMFNPFQSYNIILYSHPIYTALGIGFFIFFLLFLVKLLKKDTSLFIKINIVLLLVGLTMFELGPILGRDLYPLVIKFIPFLTNAPYYGLYVANVPLLFLMGMIGLQYKKTFSLLAMFLLLIAVLPFLNLSAFELQKYLPKEIPTAYNEYFIKPYYGIPEATHYVPYFCWRAEYMSAANTPTQCFNRGITYAPIAFDNPRAISGLQFKFVKDSFLNTNVNNLRITHNLKNIIVANDIVEEVDAGPQYSDEDIEKVKKANEAFKKNNLLEVKNNENFSHYYFKDKESYDFFIYSPQKIIIKDSIESIFDNSLVMQQRPVIISNKDYANQQIQKDVKITYKQSSFDTTKYYLKLENITNDKPFMIHITQAFKPGWEIKWITKNEYDNRNCIEKQINFSITNNARCQYQSPFIDLETLTLLKKKSINAQSHLEGNFISNTWIVNQNFIPEYAKDGKEVYAVIVYKNQIYYLGTLLIASSVLLLIVIYTLMQELLLLQKKKV